jgi:uncharacterized membrane protein YdjX (TVP38/TMEM64 family)
MVIKKYAKILVLLGFVAIFSFFFKSGVHEHLTIESLKTQKEMLQLFVQQHYVASVILYILLYIVLIALILPTGGALTVLGGALFGTWQTTLYVILGATIGAITAFLLARYLFKSMIKEKYHSYIDRFNREMHAYGIYYLLVIRLIPIFPFFLINPLAGLTGVNIVTFAWTTAIGIAPATAIFAFAGQEIMKVEHIKDILSPKILVSLILLALVVLVPMFFQKWKLNRKTR